MFVGFNTFSKLLFKELFIFAVLVSVGTISLFSMFKGSLLLLLSLIFVLVILFIASFIFVSLEFTIFCSFFSFELIFSFLLFNEVSLFSLIILLFSISSKLHNFYIDLHTVIPYHDIYYIIFLYFLLHLIIYK